MFKYVKDSLAKGIRTRLIALIVIFVILASILGQQLFKMQIINGESYQNDFTMQIKKETTIKSTRGNIYDRDGKAIAYNKLAYNVTFEDNGSYSTNDERKLTLNSSLYHIMKVIENGGDSIIQNFKIDIGSDGNYEFTTSGTSLLRFRADVFGHAYTEDLEKEELNCTAEEMMKILEGKDWYGIDPALYSATDLQNYALPSEFSKVELLKMVTLRYAVSLNSYQKYVTTTISKDISEDTVAIIMENKDNYPGVDVVEGSIRVYEDGIYLAPLIGYTGQISSEELEELNGEDGSGDYTSNDIVGKSGLEQYFEKQLRGQNGQETVYVNNLGKILKQDSHVDPQAGDDIYLTIDRDLQISVYKILEKYIAGIVYNKIVDQQTFDTTGVSSDDILIPVYDVYYSLFENNIIDAKHLASDDASSVEQKIYSDFLDKESSIFSEIKDSLVQSNPDAYADLTDEWKAYQSYIVTDVLMKATGILDEDKVDTNDETYIKWSKDESISMKEYLTYAVSKNWIDVSKMNIESEYLDTEEIYNALADYISDYLSKDDTFSRKVYKYMIENNQISGSDVCLLLFDQGILNKSDADYDALSNGTISAYDFIRAKIYSLEITPAMLALEPYSGSAVITDPSNGDVLACVTYPGYDNNRLANEMDDDYFIKLNTDRSTPFYNKATQEATAPGSTFKLVTATAGVDEGVISLTDTINCTGQWKYMDTPINCWIYSEALKGGAHGPLTLSQAITESCNYFFNTVGYMLGESGPSLALQTPETDKDGNTITASNYSDSDAIDTLTKYANLYGFDATSGVQISETSPHIATKDAARMAMGQSDNAYTTTQLARYVSTLANSGTCYDLTLLDKVTDQSGNILEEPEPVVHSTVDNSAELWNAIHTGMNGVYKNNAAFTDIKNTFNMAGKTGTAQESEDKANHALFIGYAPYDNPEIGMAVRITNGYSSTNAAAVAKDIACYYFNLKNKEEILDGTATTVASTNAWAD